MNLHEACTRKETTLYQLAFDSGVSYPRLLMVASGTVRLLEAEESRIENMLDAKIDWEEMFGKRQTFSLQVARLARSVTQEVLAKHSGVNQARISQYENGILRLNTGEKQRIENVMDLINQINWEVGTMETPNEMPEMNIGKTSDSILAVKAHLETKHGKEEAAKRLKAMSASDLITLADDISNGKSSESETNEMPKMHITRNIRN